MKILMISCYGDSADIAMRMELEGNDCRLFIKDPKYKEIGDGLVKKVENLSWGYHADLIVFDDNECTQEWRILNKLVPCFGGSPWAAKLEHDRGFAHQLMEEVGFEKIESHQFPRIEPVIDHIKTHKVRHVIKPQGKQVESHDTIISDFESGEDALELLERLKKSGKHIEKWEIEERIMGLEVGVGVFSAGHTGFVHPTEVNFEHKRMADGDLGPLTAEAGTVLKHNHDMEHPIFLETLKKMEKICKAQDFIGQIDINMIAQLDGDGKPKYKPLEFTPRLGKPSIFIQSEAMLTDWGKIFHDLANRFDPNIKTLYDWCAGVVLFANGFPNADAYQKISKGLPILGITNFNHIHPWQAKVGNNDRLVCSGRDGMILTATGKGRSIYEACDNAYHEMRPLKLQNGFYRQTIGKKVAEIDTEAYGITKPRQDIVLTDNA